MLVITPYSAWNQKLLLERSLFKAFQMHDLESWNFLLSIKIYLQ